MKEPKKDNEIEQANAMKNYLEASNTEQNGMFW